MKKLILVVLFLSTALLPIQARAEFKVPVSKETGQWKVELLAPSNNKDLAQGDKGKYEVYSLLVTNKRGKVYNVHVGAFRDEQGTSKMSGLAPQMKSDEIVKGQTFSFENFPVKTGTNKLEFVITWNDDPIKLMDGKKVSGRPFKETVVFDHIN